MNSVNFQPRTNVYSIPNTSLKQVQKADIYDSQTDERNISSEAASALKSQVLYSQDSKKDEFVEYLKSGMTQEEINNVLKNKELMGNRVQQSLVARANAYRMFKSKNPELEIKNFNILMNAKDIEMTNDQFYFVQGTASKINNGNLKSVGNYNGGELTKENIESILSCYDIVRQTEAQGNANAIFGMGIGMCI